MSNAAAVVRAAILKSPVYEITKRFLKKKKVQEPLSDLMFFVYTHVGAGIWFGNLKTLHCKLLNILCFDVFLFYETKKNVIFPLCCFTLCILR